jgi:phytoene dehydrogenase-like protein
VAALFRLATYATDQRGLSAGAAVDQLRLALHGVLFLDGGWQTIVDGLLRDVQTRGGRVQAGRRVAAIDRDEEAIQLRLADGGQIACRRMVLATAPDTVAELVPEAAPHVVGGADHPPVLAACLDVALRRLPEPRQLFFLGIDRPVYASVHSAAAKLAPGDAALVHVLKYLDRPATDSAAVEQELESLLDQFQPGWRSELVERRYLPNMRVVERLPSAAGGGLQGRPAVALPNCDNIYLAGDWVGATGMLADASFASGRRAAELILAQRSQRPQLHATRGGPTRRGEPVC